MVLISSNKLEGADVGEEVDFSNDSLDTRMDDVEQRINNSVFTSGSDKKKVPAMYKAYAERITDMVRKTLPLLQRTLAFAAADGGPSPQKSATIAVPDQPRAPPPRFAPGQMLLIAPDTSRRPALIGRDDLPRRAYAAQVCTPTAEHLPGRTVLLIGGDEVELSIDTCIQTVLPWQPAIAERELAMLASDADPWHC